MRIVLKSEGKTKFRLSLPTGLVLNSVSAVFVRRAMAQNGVKLTREQTVAIFDAIKGYKRTHPEWNLVEVQSADGEYILVRL